MIRRAHFFTGIILGTIVLMTSMATGYARTLPVKGALLKPRSFKIRMPFPCGTKVRVICGYGPHCSPAHKRVRASHSTNDYYALDLIRLDGKNGYDKPILAVASGIVRYAGWTKRGWSPYGKIVYIEHTFRDRVRRKYQTLYAHLNRVLVRAGQRVKAGSVIGTLGGSSKGRLRHFGPHLHFAMYVSAGPTLGGGHAVVPEPMGHFSDLRPKMVMTACGKPETPVAVFSPLYFEEAWGGLVIEAEK